MRHPGKYILAILLLALFTVLSVQSLYETGQNSFWDPVEAGDETFRAKFFSEELEEEDLSEECKALQRQVAGEIQYFPGVWLRFHIMRIFQRRKKEADIDQRYWAEQGWLGRKRPWKET